jgi:hypothetical protein
MTQTVERPPLRRPAVPARRAAPSLLPAATAALWALGAGLVAITLPVLLAWATDGRSGAGAAEATRTAGQLWVLAHGASLAVPGGTVGLTPLGLALLPLALLHRAGRHSARTAPVPGLRAAGQLSLAIALPYGIGAAVVAAASATTAVRPAPVQALLAGVVIALLGAGSGVLRETGQLALAGSLPDRVRRVAVGGGAAAGTIVAAGAALGGLALAVHAGRVTSLAGASAPGFVGGVVLLALGVLLVPNAAVWGASWLAGPGFAVGSGTTVGPFATTLGPVPSLPLLGALPGGPTPVWLGVAVLALPVAAGVLGGLLVSRRLATASLRTAAWEAALVGPAAGVALALLAYLSGGPLGGHRLAAVGPSPWRVGLAVAVEVALAAAVTAVAAAHRRQPSR